MRTRSRVAWAAGGSLVAHLAALACFAWALAPAPRRTTVSVALVEIGPASSTIGTIQGPRSGAAAVATSSPAPGALAGPGGPRREAIPQGAAPPPGPTHTAKKPGAAVRVRRAPVPATSTPARPRPHSILGLEPPSPEAPASRASERGRSSIPAGASVASGPSTSPSPRPPGASLTSRVGPAANATAAPLAGGIGAAADTLRASAPARPVGLPVAGGVAPDAAASGPGALGVSRKATPVGGGGVSLSDGSASGATAALLAELHARLARSARACYPAAARRFRLRGEALLHFCLDGAGGARQIHLEGSTGSAVLDEAASGCVLQGTTPPEGLRGCFELPVRFGG